jgi:hypothetical protein
MQSLQDAAATGYQPTSDLYSTAQPDICDADAIMQRLYAQQLQQPHVQAPPVCSAPPEISFSSTLDTACTALPLPLMPPQRSAAAERRSMAADLLSSCPALAVPALPEPDLAAGRTFIELIAPGQVLRDAFMTLPLVFIEEQEEQHGPEGGQDAMLAKRLKPRNLMPSQLLLDWSLADPGAPDPSGRILQAMKELRAALQPREHPAGQTHARRAWPDLVSDIAGPPVCSGDKSRRPEELPAAVQRRLASTQHAGSAEAAACVSSKGAAEAVDRGGADAQRALPEQPSAGLACSTHQELRIEGIEPQKPAAASSAAQAAKQQSAGVFIKPQTAHRSRPPSSDAAFFLGLQPGHAGIVANDAKPELAALEAASSSSDSLVGRCKPCTICHAAVCSNCSCLCCAMSNLNYICQAPTRTHR